MKSQEVRNASKLRLVQFETSDGLRLNGILADAGSDTTIIHIHGKGGNFYENKFVKIMLDQYPSAGFNFLSFNNRGHSSYVEAYQHGDISYVGSAVEMFNDCLLDLEAAKHFALTLGSNVVFQGHSFGCEKIMYYSQHVDPSAALILLSPCDGYRLQAVYIAPETVEEQVARLRADYRCVGLEWLPPQEYGVQVPGAQYHVPITARSLVDLISGPAFRLLALDKSWTEPLISARAFAYLGGRDALQVDGVDPMHEGLQTRFQNINVAIFPEGDHHLRPIIPGVIDRITSWISEDM